MPHTDVIEELSVLFESILSKFCESSVKSRVGSMVPLCPDTFFESSKSKSKQFWSVSDNLPKY